MENRATGRYGKSRYMAVWKIPLKGGMGKLLSDGMENPDIERYGKSRYMAELKIPLQDGMENRAIGRY